MENIKITNTDLTNTIYSDLLNWQYNSQVTTDGKIDYFKFKNENDLVFSDVWVIKMTDEGLNMNDKLVYLYRKSINSTLMFTPNVSCEQSLSYLREDPYRMSITYYFKRKDKGWDSSNIFSRTFYGYSDDTITSLDQEADTKPKFHMEDTDYDLQCLIEGVVYGGGWYGRITNNYILDVLNSSSSKTICPVYKLPRNTLNDNELPDISSTYYDLVIPFTIDASFLGLTDQGNGWFSLRESSLRNVSLLPYSWTNTDDNSLDNQGFVKVYTYVIDYSTSEKGSWFSDPDIPYFDSEEDAFNESGFTINKKPLTKLLPTYPCLDPFTEVLIKPDETYVTYLPFDRSVINSSNSGWTFVIPMKRNVSSASNNSGLENFIGVADSSSIDYNFDLNQNQNRVVFRNYNRNISCSPASTFGQTVDYGALYPGSYRDNALTINKSNSIAVVAGYIRAQRLLINLKESFNPTLENHRTLYTIYNPYPISIKVVYSRYINQYDFDDMYDLDYFRKSIWPYICQRGYFNCALTGHQVSITRDYIISNESKIIGPYSSSDITVDLYCKYSSNENIRDYVSLAYSFGNPDNPFPYISSSLFKDRNNWSNGGENTIGSFNIIYSLPADGVASDTSIKYKSYFWKNLPGYGTFQTSGTISLWTNSSHWYVDVKDLPAVNYNSSGLAQYIDLSKKEISVNAVLSNPSSYIRDVIEASDTAFPGYVVWYVKADQEDRAITNGITSLKWGTTGYTFYVLAKIPDWYPTSTQYTYKFYYLYGMLGQGSTSTWHSFTLTKI